MTTGKDAVMTTRLLCRAPAASRSTNLAPVEVQPFAGKLLRCEHDLAGVLLEVTDGLVNQFEHREFVVLRLDPFGQFFGREGTQDFDCLVHGPADPAG